MEIFGYDVTKYIYTAHDINFFIQTVPSCGRWIGYLVISSNDSIKKLVKRDILITFKGTITNPESIRNLMSSKLLQPPSMLIEHNLFHPRFHWGLSYHPRGFVMGGQSPLDFHYVLFFFPKKRKKE